LLKWSWSTIYLGQGKSASCHRTDQYTIPPDNFASFHNLPEKISARELMLEGKWPQGGCQYCEKIEAAGGMSDRLYQIHSGHDQQRTPVELLSNPTALEVVPTILEIYFNNTCNMSCLYCGNHFSSKWEEEDRRFGEFKSKYYSFGTVTPKNPNYDNMLEQFWQYLHDNDRYKQIRQFQVAGGEPFFQKELEQCLDFFDTHPSPELCLNLVSNLKVEPRRFARIIDRMIALKDAGKLKRIQITGSLDCWGPQQEYVRWGLDLAEYTANMEYMLTKDITICINAAVNALSIKTMPEYFEKINYWNQLKKDLGFKWDYINWSCTSVPSPGYMKPDIFGPDVFRDDIERTLSIMPEDNEQQKNIKEHFRGIAAKIASRPKNPEAIENLKVYLTEMDRRRGTDWTTLFPWLVNQ
jgi:hypothetical protein